MFMYGGEGQQIREAVRTLMRIIYIVQNGIVQKNNWVELITLQIQLPYYVHFHPSRSS